MQLTKFELCHGIRANSKFNFLIKNGNKIDLNKCHYFILFTCYSKKIHESVNIHFFLWDFNSRKTRKVTTQTFNLRYFQNLLGINKRFEVKRFRVVSVDRYESRGRQEIVLLCTY